MAKKKRKKAVKSNKGKQGLPIQVKFTLLFAVLIFYLLAMLSSKTGLAGEFIRKLTLGIFGFSGYLLPLAFFFLFLVRLNPRMKKNKERFSAGIITLFIMTSFIQGYMLLEPILKIFADNIDTFRLSYETGILGSSAGVFGNLLIVLTYKAAGRYGLLVLALLLGLLSLYFFTRLSIADFQKVQVKKTKSQPAPKRKPRPREKKSKDKKDSFLFGTTRAPQALDDRPKLDDSSTSSPREFSFTDDYDHVKIDLNDQPLVSQAAEEEIIFTEPIEEPLINIPEPSQEPIVVSQEEPVQEPIRAQNKASREEKVEPLELSIDEKKKLSKAYRKPPLSLFERASRSKNSGSGQKKLMLELAKKLERVLNNFSVQAKVVEVSRGPIVNRFEIQLEPGTKISKITGLQDDIALNMAVPQVRVAPIQGKSTIGIEIPNKVKDSVGLKEILASKEFKTIDSKLAVALGKDISGKPVAADLSTMPHLLIAGSTGSGKSVCINTIIASLLYNAGPDEVKLLMIDPKVVELSNYNGIPHLILPVVTDPKKAAMALGWAVNEMTRRYELFAQSRVKDIKGYNKKEDDKLARIVVIIDELADLMMVAPTQVEDSIARLSQMARAAGIHLIVATQRPSAEVITGQIKTNIPSRISFAVSSAIDSRIILDASGAEKLLGRGDMLYSPFGSNRPQRVQGSFVSESEINSLVEFIKDQEIETEYKEEIVEKSAQPLEREFDDEYLEDAIRMVIDAKSASASMLQRRFRIGYNRAGRLIDMMFDMGIIGPPQASKPRDVLVSDFEEVEPWN